MNVAAKRRDDARLFLVSLAFLASSGFFMLHALATPGVLVHHANVGFDVAQPVGLLLAAVFAVASSVEWKRRLPITALQVLLAGLIVAWGTVSLLDLPPLNATPGPREVSLPVAAVTIALYLYAALRYFLLHRRRPSAMLISVITAFVLLAEAMVTVTFAHKWQLSWWEWHLLLALA